MEKRIKIVFYATIFQSRATGINNLIMGIINAITSIEGMDVILVGNKEFHESNLRKLKNKNRIKIIIDKKINTILGGFFLNKLYKKEKYDYIFGPAGVLPFFIDKERIKILYVHDFVYKNNPDTMELKVKLIMNLLGDSSVKKADIIWTNSNYTMEETEKYFDLSKKKLLMGASIDTKIFKNLNLSKEEVQKMKVKYGISKKTLLFVGTLEPRKNIDFLINLMPNLEKKGFQLIVVGGKGWGKTRIKEQLKNLSLDKNTINFLGYISDQELVELYNIVDIYISTSKNEGLGLPQMEAISCGCPVISSHNSAMIEVVEGVGETVKGWNKDEWIKTVEKVYLNRRFYQQKSQKMRREYSWENIVKRFIKIIEKKSE